MPDFLRKNLWVVIAVLAAVAGFLLGRLLREPGF
jgi:ElaB/YqjD/DUF883 family membrane-anchored ribosome-binding protein